jgi:hypothetical protein|tara:strand:+ start:318 stop:671 length:354 start_codon:yes stop_codon:yes gene_type:complete
MIKKITIAALLIFSTQVLGSDPQYYHGEDVEICSPPTEIVHRSEVNGSPYFLNYGSRDSSTYLTIVIWERDVHKLEINPYTYFKVENVCVRGRITSYRNNRQIILREPSQLFVSKNK